MVNGKAELRHWFFQSLNPDQRAGFLFACGYGRNLELGLQYKAIDHVAEAIAGALQEAAAATVTCKTCCQIFGAHDKHDCPGLTANLGHSISTGTRRD